MRHYKKATRFQFPNVHIANYYNGQLIMSVFALGTNDFNFGNADIEPLSPSRKGFNTALVSDNSSITTFNSIRIGAKLQGNFHTGEQAGSDLAPIMRPDFASLNRPFALDNTGGQSEETPPSLFGVTLSNDAHEDITISGGGVVIGSVFSSSSSADNPSGGESGEGTADEKEVKTYEQCEEDALNILQSSQDIPADLKHMAKTFIRSYPPIGIWDDNTAPSLTGLLSVIRNAILPLVNDTINNAPNSPTQQVYELNEKVKKLLKEGDALVNTTTCEDVAPGHTAAVKKRMEELRELQKRLSFNDDLPSLKGALPTAQSISSPYPAGEDSTKQTQLEQIFSEVSAKVDQTGEWLTSPDFALERQQAIEQIGSSIAKGAHATSKYAVAAALGILEALLLLSPRKH